MNKILIVEDDASIREGLQDNLESEGFIVTALSDGREALKVGLAKDFDIILLDVMLPGISGFEICSELRKNEKKCPIILLTARGEEMDKVTGLQIGADDYVTKPFSIKEVIARINAHLRRQDHFVKEITQFEMHDVLFDFKKHETKKSGKNVDLTPLEYKVMIYFIQRPGQVISRDELIEKVWGYDSAITTRTIDNHILNLRKIIEPDPKKPVHFITIHGVGYKFIWDN